MNILQITKKPPFPLNDGESWAVRNLARGLISHGAKVHLLSLVSDQYEVERWIHEVSDIYESVDIIRYNTQPTKRGALINLLSSKSYHQERFEGAVRAIDALQDVSDYDVILAETLYTMPLALHIQKTINTPIILRAHNQEHLIWQEYSKGLDGLKKWYFNSQSRKLHRYELDMVQKASGVLFVSKEDQEIVREVPEVRSEVIPIALDLAHERRQASIGFSEPIILGSLGSLDWKPNIQGLQKFLNEIWPHLKKSYDDIRLIIAGKNPDRQLLSIRDSDVSLIGQVEDSSGFISQLHALIVPLWSGSGARVKILETMSLGVPVLTTPKGCEGLDVIHERHLFIADKLQDWQDSIQALDNQSLVSDMQSNARRYISEDHSVETIGLQAYHFIQGIS